MLTRFIIGTTLYLLCGITQSWAQCPQSPNLNVRYSNRFYQAQKTFIERSRSAGTQMNVTLPAQVPIPIGGSQISANELKRLQAVEIDTAYTYIQEELKDQRTAIVAECVAALCQANAGGPLQVHAGLRIQAVVSICRDALGFEAGGWTGAQVVALPSPLMVVFRGNETKRTVRVHVANLTGGTMRMRINEPDDLTPDERKTMLALFAGKKRAKRFRLKPQERTSIPFVVRRPDSDEGPRSYTVDIVSEPNNAIAATVTFYLIHSSEELLPPPELPCGVANPRAHIKTNSDDGRTHEEIHSSSVMLHPGSEVKGGPSFEWVSNGGGGAKAEYRMSCPRATKQRRSGTVRFEFTGTAGGKCARNGSNKGGQGHNDPNWNTQISLPGYSNTKWMVKIAARAKRFVHNGSCKIIFGVSESRQVPLDESIITLEKKDLPPGEYSIELDCIGEDGACYGGPEYTWNSGTDNVAVEVEAKR